MPKTVQLVSGRTEVEAMQAGWRLFLGSVLFYLNLTLEQESGMQGKAISSCEFRNGYTDKVSTGVS